MGVGGKGKYASLWKQTHIQWKKRQEPTNAPEPSTGKTCSIGAKLKAIKIDMEPMSMLQKHGCTGKHPCLRDQFALRATRPFPLFATKRAAGLALSQVWKITKRAMHAFHVAKAWGAPLRARLMISFATPARKKKIDLSWPPPVLQNRVKLPAWDLDHPYHSLPDCGITPPMSQIESLFVTRLYRAALSEHGPKVDPDELEASCYGIAEDDEAGQEWCEQNGYPGYTSYASLTDLGWRNPVFADVIKSLDLHVAEFAKDLEFNLDGRNLVLEDLWINILPEGGMHSSHLHPHSVISGTTYVSMPEGTSALKLEDPRSGRLMAAPPRLKEARRDMRTFVYIKPDVGDVLLWESWLRHEVPMNMAEDERVSVSFNYRWE